MDKSSFKNDVYFPSIITFDPTQLNSKGMHIGLFFGSFNPVHVGHLMIAQYMVESTAMDQVWFVVSPHNPLKEKKSLLNEYDRLHLVELAIAGNEQLKASNIEFSLPQPSYTVDTLTYLHQKYNHEFALIMGSDNLATLHKWKNYDQLLSNHFIYIYPRPGFTADLLEHPNVKLVEDVPLLPISSTFLRSQIQVGKSMRYFLPDPVWSYVQEMNLYR